MCLCASFSKTGAGLCIYHLLEMVKLKFLAHFPVDHLADPVMCRFILLLYYFAVFAYYEIDPFVSVTASSTFAILLRLIYFRFDMIGSYGVVLCCY